MLQCKLMTVQSCIFSEKVQMQQIVGIPSRCVFFSILIPGHSKYLFTNSSRTVWELWNFKNTILF